MVTYIKYNIQKACFVFFTNAWILQITYLYVLSLIWIFFIVVTNIIELIKNYNKKITAKLVSSNFLDLKSISLASKNKTKINLLLICIKFKD